jgi:hypothetical protein
VRKSILFLEGYIYILVYKEAGSVVRFSGTNSEGAEKYLFLGRLHIYILVYKEAGSVVRFSGSLS